MIHSMTGFAVASRDLGSLTLNIELRGVNSRYLDLALRLSDDLRLAEPLLREQISARLIRGKVECRLGLQRNGSAPRDLALNLSLLGQLSTAQATIRQRLPEAGVLSVSDILHWPGMLADDSPAFEQLQPEIAALLQQALNDFVAARQREGEKLAAVIQDRVDQLRQLVTLTPRVPAVVAEYQERLVQRLREAVATLDEDRIRHEVGVFAQRIDVSEELARLTVHLDEVSRILKSKGAAGKRLDFLMQELNREANTFASKSASSDLTAQAVEMKLLIEQMREQIQNIE